MSDFEGISDRTPRIKIKPQFDRLLPEGGVKIRHRNNTLHFIDVHDTPPDLIEAVTSYFKSEVTENPNLAMSNIKVGLVTKGFRVYVLHNGRILGVISLLETDGSPHGYGQGDFLLQTFTLPGYRKTALERRAMNDLNFFVFKSGIVKRWYSYIRIKNDHQSFTEFGKIDPNINPCTVKFHSGDSYSIQTFLKLEKTVGTVDGFEVGILECDGDVYQKMDWMDYAKKAASSQNVDATDQLRQIVFDDLNEAVKKIKGEK